MFLRPLVFLLLVTVVTVKEHELVENNHVQTKNGICIYEDDGKQKWLIEDGGEAFDIKKCKAMICAIDDRKGQVTVFRCPKLTGISKDGKECPLNITGGKYPHCCFGALLCD